MADAPGSPEATEAVATAERLARLLHVVPDGEVRVATARRELSSLPPALCAAALAVLLRGAAAREVRAGDALAALVRALDGAPAYAQRAAIYEAALASGEAPVASLFLELPARRAFADRDQVHDASLADLTLGHRMALARGGDPETLMRLALIAEPQVIDNLLQNPRLTLAIVLRLAARRPMKPSALAAVARSRRFGASREVRRAICQNPYSPTDLALRLLPLLLAQDWREILGDLAAHERIRSEARRLLSARGGHEEARATSGLDPAEEKRLVEEARRLRSALRSEAEAAERAREETASRDELLSLIESFEGGGLPLRKVDEGSQE